MDRPDFLLTGFHSFTQDHEGRPLPNPTEILLRLLSDTVLTGTAFWQGLALLGGRRCALAVAEVNYSTPSRIVELAREIRPKFILSLGLGSETVFETGAVNTVAPGRDVYDREGRPLVNARPDNVRIDADLPGHAEIALPWGAGNVARLREVAARWSQAGDFSPLGPVRVAPAARPDNNYVCNATAWAVARAATQTGAPPPFRHAGFLHLAPPKTPSDGYFLAAANLLVDVVRAIRPE